MANTSDYSIDYEDERLTDIKTEETKVLTQNQMNYEGMMGDVDNAYKGLSDATEAWKNEQIDIQNKQTDFTIEQIEQQKEQAQKDYTKEQAGAYVDWRKQSNQYGSEAEKMASAGLSNTGFSESSQVSMYNTYQNRVAVARESFNQVWASYENKINEARLQNSAAIAEIATTAMMQQAEYVVQSVTQQQQLFTDMMNNQYQIQSLYNDKWKTELDSMNKALDRQWQSDENAQEREWKTEHDKAMAEIEHKYAIERDEINNAFTEKMAEINHNYEIKLLNAKTEKEKEKADYEHKLAMEKLEQEHKNDLAILDKELANDKALAKYNSDLSQQSKSYSFSSGSSGGSTKAATTAASAGISKIQSAKFTGTTYNSAVSYMKSKGVSASGLMTAGEWERRRNSYKSTGQGAVEVKNFSSYADYLQAYVAYKTGG